MKLKYFKLAEKLASKANYVFKIGAVIVRKNRIIGQGFNKPHKTSPASNHPYRTIHAELAAILSTRQSVFGADIYIFRADAKGIPALAKPCLCCQTILSEYGIRNVYYTGYDSYESWSA